ncbi:DUF1891 domain-containing protein [Chryseolinea soli]|uniref:DUF1891 domain-containing protein n=1 Tax=Chryseolinea soli TaxID=2321403 RepID=A0A385SRQ0_9BACT|nr:DUF1891 domain-containing protein [Chryseolinea soli]
MTLYQHLSGLKRVSKLAKTSFPFLRILKKTTMFRLAAFQEFT